MPVAPAGGSAVTCLVVAPQPGGRALDRGVRVGPPAPAAPQRHECDQVLHLLVAVGRGPAVQGVLRFPTVPTSVRGATLRGRSVSFSAVLGAAGPVSLRVDVRGGGTPHLRLVAEPTKLVRALAPPAASSWVAALRKRSIPSRVLLRTLIDTRMQLVRSDQYQAFLANPDPQGAAKTVYVYESAAAPTPKGSPSAESGSGTLSS